MKKASRTIIVTLALLASMAAGSNVLRSQSTMKPNSAQVAKPELAQLQAAAAKAQASIQASAAETKAIVAAVRAKNEDQAKSVLLKSGFTAKQIEGAKIVLVDDTGGKDTMARIHVHVSVTGPPWTITITITFTS
jgi:hypothetical protein